jgi:carboxypeptidase Q
LLAIGPRVITISTNIHPYWASYDDKKTRDSIDLQLKNAPRWFSPYTADFVFFRRIKLRHLLSTLTLSLLFVGSLGAQEIKSETLQQAQALRETALQSELAWDVLESLTTEVGPRMAGSEGDARAVAWGVAKFKQLGFDKVWTEAVTVPVWKRLHEKVEITGQYAQPLTVTALGHSIATPEGGLEAEVIEFPSYEDLVAAPEHAADGKIVYISNKMERHPSGRGYGKSGPARFMGPVEAAKKGAIGLVIRSVGTDNERTAHTGKTNYTEGVTKIPAAALSNPDADQLDRILKLGKPVSLKMDILTEFLPDAVSYNVIGEVTGSQKPKEIVAIGGHLDSWDLGTGAVDDGAGIAITVAAAKLIAEQQRPRRTIRVVMFAAEEIGVYGGNQYALVHKNELNDHIIGAESDSGAGRVLSLSSKVSGKSLPAIDAMLKLMAPLDIVRSSKEASGSADFGPMVDAGMPAVGLEQDHTVYFDLHHTANDTLNKVVPEELAQNVAAWAIFVKIAADWEGRFDK